MPSKSHHVVPALDGGWNVIKRGASRASKHFDKKADAVSYGRKLSQSQRSEFVVHKKDGTVQHKDSYDNRSLPPQNGT